MLLTLLFIIFKLIRYLTIIEAPIDLSQLSSQNATSGHLILALL
jgi:hypothetical protein